MSFKIGDFVIGKPGNPGGYSYTSDYAVCRVTRTRGGGTISVRLVAVLAGHSHGTAAGLQEWGVNARDFELYDTTKHGSNVIKGALPPEAMFSKVEGLYFEPVGEKLVVVIDEKLKSYGKVFEIKERYETGFVNIGKKRPIIIREEKLRGVDKDPIAGDFAVRKPDEENQPENIYKVLSVSENGTVLTVKCVFGPNKSSVSQQVFTRNFLRANTANEEVLKSVPLEKIQEFAAAEKARSIPRKFWMVAVHTEEGIYPPTSDDGLYAPRRKFYSETVARRVLEEMSSRHDRRFYLLEAIETIEEGEAPVEL